MKLALALLLAAACSPGNPVEVASTAPVPDAPTAPIATTVAVSPDGDSLLLSDPVVVLAPGIVSTGALWIVAARDSSAFEVVLAQVDTTAAVLRALPLYYNRGGLSPADFPGTVLSEADVVVLGTFGFASAGPSFKWALPIEGKAPGKALIHVFWQRADGEKLPSAVVEARVR